MNKKQFTLKLSAVAVAVLLASCGGGNGYYNSNSSDQTGGGAIVSAVNITNVSLYDAANILTTSITATGVTAKVKVTDVNGKGISGALVTFTGSGVVLGTSNGAVLTNADGEASISVKPEDMNATGAYQISAAVDYNGSTATTKSATNFTLQATNIVLVGMSAASTTLASGGSTNITLKTQDASTKANQNNVTVNFSASCGTFEPATVVSSNQGDVTTSYKAIGANGKLCEGTQTITASGSNIPTSKIDVNIAAIEANSLVYTTSAAVNLGITSSGSASSDQIEFTLYANGTPAENKDVNIELVRAPEDLSFVSLGNRAVKTVKSDPNGKVVVTVYPGNKPGPVEIKATLASNNAVSALSKNVAVSTGRVTQDGLSLSMSKNSLRNDIDGDTATITARMVDRTGNPVPDGTVISFISEGGSITPNCSSVKGSCTVTLSTQNPRPLDNRVTVLAYVEGDKSYLDKNGNNVYDEGVDELVSNIGDFFRDDNENNQYDANLGEFIYKKAAGTLQCAASTITQSNIPNTCGNGLSAVIRQQLLFAFASDTPTFVDNNGFEYVLNPDGVTKTKKISSGNASFTFQLFGNSEQKVPMPSGTAVSVTVKDNTPNNNQACEADLRQGSLPVADVMDLLTPSTFGNASNNIVKYSVRLTGCEKGDDVKIITSVPSGKTTTQNFDIK